MAFPILQSVNETDLPAEARDNYRRLRRRVYAFIVVNLIFGGLIVPLELLGVLLLPTGVGGVAAAAIMAVDTLFAAAYFWLVRRGYMALGTLLSVSLSIIAVSVGIHLAGFTFSYSILYLLLILAVGLLLEDPRLVVYTALLSSGIYLVLAMLEIGGLWPSARGLVSVPAFSASIVVILSVLISLWGGAAIVALFLRDEAARTTQLREARHLAERHAKDQAEARERLEQVLAQRDQVVAQLQAALAERDLLDRTVQGLSVPIVPVWEGILVLPLVGGIDAERAAGVLDSLLRGVEQRRARTVIIDITGVPMVDTRVAQLLVDAARAASLMGCRAVLTGIRPEVAHALVDLGADLSTLVTRADLQSGVEYALQLNHRR